MDANNLEKKLKTLDKYPLEEAKTCIRYYVDNGLKAGLKNESIIRAFTVKAIDVVDTLGITVGKDGTLQFAYDSFRAYLGQDPGTIDPKLKNAFKLFLAPVNTANEDVIPTGKEGQYVYDFNTPCPNSCDLKSPLFYSGLSFKEQ